MVIMTKKLCYYYQMQLHTTYVMKACITLNVFFPNMIHVTCLTHMIQKIVEKVKELFPNVNILVNNFKKVFLKAHNRVEAYKENIPYVTLLPKPVLTRWGTWIKEAVFCTDHFELLKIIIIEKLKDENVASIKNVKICLS